MSNVLCKQMYNMYIYYINYIYKARRLWTTIERGWQIPLCIVLQLYNCVVVNHTFWQKCSEDNFSNRLNFVPVRKKVYGVFYWNLIDHFCKTNAGRHLSYILTNLVGKVSNHYVRGLMQRRAKMKTNHHILYIIDYSTHQF